MSRHLIGWVLATTVIATALGGPVLAGSDQGGNDCVEIPTVQDFFILDDGKVLLLPRSGRQGLKGTSQFGGGTSETPDMPLVVIIDPSGRIVSLPAGELLPDGRPPRTPVGAACGLPEGLSLAVPVRWSRTTA